MEHERIDLASISLNNCLTHYNNVRQQSTTSADTKCMFVAYLCLSVAFSGACIGIVTGYLVPEQVPDIMFWPLVGSLLFAAFGFIGLAVYAATREGAK